MPKIIVDIKKKILHSAEELFIVQGYDDTDIRQIASRANVAVGTLYNYYRSKQELFFAVFKHSWQRTLSLLDEVVDNTSDPQQCARKFLVVLHQEVHGRERNGWKRLLQVYGYDKKHKSQIFEAGQHVQEVLTYLTVLMIKIIYSISEEYSVKKLSEATARRLAHTVLTTFFALSNHMPNEIEENIDYICSIINCICMKGNDNE